jgi:hypothetical protein
MAILTMLALSSCSTVDRMAGIATKATRLCVTNLATVAPVAVNWERSDTSDRSGVLPTGGVVCGEGWFSSGNDVVARIDLEAPLRTKWAMGNNAFLQTPHLVLAEAGGKYLPEGQWCSEVAGDAAPDTWDDGILRYTLTRLPDSDWKEFTLTVEDSQSPTPDTAPRACTGSPDKPDPL